ncbi:Paf1 complex component [Microsporum audouinii]
MDLDESPRKAEDELLEDENVDNSPPALDDDGDMGLFGSGSEEEEEDIHERRRKLDDVELDSGDDEGRYDRAGSPMEEDGMEYGGTLNIMDLSLGRAPEPEPTDGQVFNCAIPNFLSIESEDFNPETYVAPPFSSASTSLCWRTSPDGSELQSNARIIRWSDGSLTLQLASNPTEQYRISSKPLAQASRPGKREEYDPDLDAHTYLGVASEASSVIRLTSRITSSLSILPSTVETDDAVQRLQESLAAAARSGKKTADGSVAIIEVKQDPELAKKQAEQAEREKLREARKRQAAVEREVDRGRRSTGFQRAGAGLTIADLEGDEDMAITKSRGGAKRPARKPRRRDDIYSDEEDDYDRRGRTREDEYDEDDGFLVGSDEEPEVEEDEEEEEMEDEDMDAEGEIDDDVPPAKSTGKASRPSGDESESPGQKGASPQARKKHRYVVDDDDDE